MTSDETIKQKKGRDVYSHYRETLRRPELTKEEIDAAQQTLQAIARAICEHVWGKKFY